MLRPIAQFLIPACRGLPVKRSAPAKAFLTLSTFLVATLPNVGNRGVLAIALFVSLVAPPGKGRNPLQSWSTSMLIRVKLGQFCAHRNDATI